MVLFNLYSAAMMDLITYSSYATFLLPRVTFSSLPGEATLEPFNLMFILNKKAKFVVSTIRATVPKTIPIIPTMSISLSYYLSFLVFVLAADCAEIDVLDSIVSASCMIGIISLINLGGHAT